MRRRQLQVRKSPTLVTTHRFYDAKDPTRGGTWFGDTGRRICDWSWDAATKTLTVTLGMRTKRIDLTNIGERLWTPEELRQRLPQMALDSAQQIGKRTDR